MEERLAARRVAVQGSPNMLTAVTNVYQPGARANTNASHRLRNILSN